MRQAKIGAWRAVLSWAVPPYTTDPDALQYWGNLIDTHVQIRRACPQPLTPKMSILAESRPARSTLRGARSSTHGSPGQPAGRCPWAAVPVRRPRGNPGPGIPGFKYRIQVRRRPADCGRTWRLRSGSPTGTEPRISARRCENFFEYRDYLKQHRKPARRMGHRRRRPVVVKLEIAEWRTTRSSARFRISM